ncbi:DUF393 domain-containing protein [Viridibacterium curvum]|uniref:DUF393 domain-containing protein n=1 Tax=Viridibacterium curvum TaxID=1101404 RepID=A0ABP9QK36_9RHOO
MSTTLYPLTVYYDRACPLCRREMHALKARDRLDRLHLVDISAADFDAGTSGFDAASLDATLHARGADGTVLRGLDAIQASYEAVGLGMLYRWTRAPLVRPLMDRAYRVFAAHRNTLSPFVAPLVAPLIDLAMPRAESGRACTADSCDLHDTASKKGRH